MEITEVIFIPWDLNISFGAVYADNKYYAEETLEETGTQVQFELVAGRSRWMRIMHGHLQKRKVGRLERKSLYGRGTAGKSTASAKELTGSGAMAREMERWAGNVYGSVASDGILRKRMAYMDSMIDGL